MAHHLFLLISLLSVAAMQMQGSHATEYVVIDNSGNSKGGVRFRNEIGGVDYGHQAIGQAGDLIWSIFQLDRTSPAERKPVPKVTLFIENRDGVPAFTTANNEIHVNANYLGNYTGDVRREFVGMIHHEMTHVWQWNGKGRAPRGLIEGIADYVRLRGGYETSHWVKAGQGSRWDQGYDVTARFMDYCRSLRTWFVADLNKKMRNGYSDDYFVDLLGKTVDQLWSDYKAKYGSNN